MSAAIEVYAVNGLNTDGTKISGQQISPLNSGGVKTKHIFGTLTKGTESDGTIYRIIKGLAPAIIIKSIKLWTAAIAGLTAVDVGLYKPGIGRPALVDNCFASGLDPHAGNLRGAPIDGMAALTVPNTQQPLYLLAGETEISHEGSYDLALTLDTGGTNVGAISWEVEYYDPN